jgi:hypothetical protein
MKLQHIISIVLFCLSIVTLTLISGCGDGGSDPAPTPSKQDEVKTILTSGTWKVQSVTVDGTDQTAVYKNLTLNFSSTGYTSANGLPVWPANDTWTFGNEEATLLKRNDGVDVTINEATATSLKLGLAWNKTTLGTGRVSSVSGKHVFSFGK